MKGRVAIIGCGTAGPAAAILLDERGWDVTIFERAETIAPVGAGLLLQPAGQRVLHRLGVAEPIARRAARVERLLGHTTGGRLVLDLRYRELATGTAGLGVHRAMLLEAMLERLRQTGVDMRTGSDVESLRPRQERWSIRTSGASSDEYDLVVLADGARSRLRGPTGLVRRMREYPWGALWAIVPDPCRVYPDLLRQYYGGTKTFLGFLPSGRLRPDSAPLVSLFWSVRNDQVDALRDTDFERHRDAMLAMAPEAESILSAVQGWDDFVHARYMDVRLHRPYDSRVVCIGDAAHAMSPQLGQGVTMALLDAESLADALDMAPTIEAGLRLHHRRRGAATEFYQWANRVSTWFFQHDFAPFGWARDLAFGPLCFTPWVKGQLLRTLAGLKTGVLASESLRALPPP